jgi:hypothetical protein
VARPWGIALSALAYLVSLLHGGVISTALLILIPLLIARPQEPRYSPPPVEEEGWEPGH